MAENFQSSRICLGVIVGVHGIKGEVKVKSWTADDRNVDAYGVLENKDGSRKFSLSTVGHSKELLRCKVKGINDRNAAEALIGTELYVNRSVLPALEDEEFYQADLIGLKVFDVSTGKEAGEITGIYNFGAGDILEIKVAATQKLEMLPFTKQYVPEIHIKGGFVKVSSMLMNFAVDDDSQVHGQSKETDNEG